MPDPPRAPIDDAFARYFLNPDTGELYDEGRYEAQPCRCFDCVRERAVRSDNEYLALQERMARENSQKRRASGSNAARDEKEKTKTKAQAQAQAQAKAKKDKAESELLCDLGCGRDLLKAMMNRCRFCYEDMREKGKDDRRNALRRAFRDKEMGKDVGKIIDMLRWFTKESILLWFDTWSCVAFEEGSVEVFEFLMQEYSRRKKLDAERDEQCQTVFAAQILLRYTEGKLTFGVVTPIGPYPRNVFQFIKLIGPKWKYWYDKDPTKFTVNIHHDYPVGLRKFVYLVTREMCEREPYHTEDEVLDIWKWLESQEVLKDEGVKHEEVSKHNYLADESWLGGMQLAFRYAKPRLFRMFFDEFCRYKLDRDSWSQEDCASAVFAYMGHWLHEFSPCVLDISIASTFRKKNTKKRMVESQRLLDFVEPLSKFANEKSLETFASRVIRKLTQRIRKTSDFSNVQKRMKSLFDTICLIHKRGIKFQKDDMHDAVNSNCRPLVAFLKEEAGIEFGESAWNYLETAALNLNIDLFEYLIEHGAAGPPNKPNIERLKEVVIYACEVSSKVYEDGVEWILEFVELIEDLNDTSEEDKVNLRRIHDLFEEHKESMPEGVYVGVMTYLQRLHNESDDVREDEQFRDAINRVLRDRFGYNFAF